MELKVQLPETVAERFGGTPEAAARQLLESAAVEGYRSGRFSRGQIRQMLGLAWHEAEIFLAEHGCHRHYTPSDLEGDREMLSQLPPQDHVAAEIRE